MSETTIVISLKTREKLKEIGKKGQTYDQVIDTLLEAIDSNNLRKNKEFDS
jgi:hypothetical protein